MRLGVIGVGTIASAVIRGLLGGERPPERVLLSPRSAPVAEALAAEFAAAEVAKDNQAVIDGSETVVLALRPQDAEAALRPLTFGAEANVISLMALMPLTRVQDLVAPARSIARVLALPSSAQRLGPVVVYPGEPAATSLGKRIGSVIVARDESELDALWALTSLIAPYFALLEEATAWAERQGVERPTAGTYLASMMHGLTVLAAGARAGAFEPLVEEASTAGGLNEQALRALREAGVLAAVPRTLDAVRERLRQAETDTRGRDGA